MDETAQNAVIDMVARQNACLLRALQALRQGNFTGPDGVDGIIVALTGQPLDFEPTWPPLSGRSQLSPKSVAPAPAVKLVDWRDTPNLPRCGRFSTRNQGISAAVLHNTGGYESIQADNDYHRFQAEWTPGMKGGAAHIAYHFWISRDDATVYWCNYLEERSWHATNGNDESLGIAFQVDGEKDELTDAQKESAVWLLDVFLPSQSVTIKRSRVFGHGECLSVYGGGVDFGNNTRCPGRYVLPWVRSLRQG